MKRAAAVALAIAGLGALAFGVQDVVRYLFPRTPLLVTAPSPLRAAMVALFHFSLGGVALVLAVLVRRERAWVGALGACVALGAVGIQAIRVQWYHWAWGGWPPWEISSGVAWLVAAVCAVASTFVAGSGRPPPA